MADGRVSINQDAHFNGLVQDSSNSSALVMEQG